MDAEGLGPEVQEALDELQLYLSDSIPPLVAAGSLELLIRQPVEVVASGIRAWTGAQYRQRQAASVPVSDYLFHAIRKIHLMGEYRLVPAELLTPFLLELKRVVVSFCPGEDRELLVDNLKRLEKSAPSTLAAPISSITRQIGGDFAASAGVPEPLAGGLPGTEAGRRRFSTLLERMEAEARRSESGKEKPSSDMLAVAARRSETGKEIEEYLSRLRQMGFEIGTADVFEALARSLPEWAPPSSAAQWPSAEEPSPAVEAMHRMVADAEDPAEGARRFQELVHAAIERFNEGSLPQAASALDLAQRLVDEKKVDAGTVEVARRRGDESLDEEKLRKFAESPPLHGVLRKVLAFFSAFGPEALLEQLRREPKRDRRRLLLALLEVHGVPARHTAFERLSEPFRDLVPEEGYFRRNLLYLLRRIPRGAEESVDDEIEVVIRHARPGMLPSLLKEAIANLASLRDERAEVALAQLLADMEETVRGNVAGGPEDPDERIALIDRIVSALARMGTPAARRAVLHHALTREPKLGDTMSRLAEFSSQDLSDDPEFVHQLLALVKGNLPVKVLGLVLHQNQAGLLRAIEALSGTPSQDVRIAFEDITTRFPDKEIGRAAERALSGFRKPAATHSPSLTGDLEVFGLPALLQSLSDSGTSGLLTLLDPTGAAVGTLRLVGGKMRSCRTGRLKGRDACFQLFERPFPGTFQFVRSDRPSDLDASGTGSLYDVLPLTMEGMRRHDELREAAVLAPDEVRLKATQVPPAPHPGEKDGMLMKKLWTTVRGGATALECEAAIDTDAFRIRRLLAHWVEQGALKAEEGRRAPARG